MPTEESHQLVVLARLSEFCQWRGASAHAGEDPWSFMRRKLLEIEPALAAFKGQLLDGLRERLFSELSQGPLSAERCADYRDLLDRLLSRGDFADVAIHLAPDAGPSSGAMLRQLMISAKPHHLFVEERLPLAQRSASWNRLVEELSRRVGLDLFARMLGRGKITARRKAYVLRRIRRNVAEYCTVVRIPTSASDTLTPFMLPRVEALVAANLRFLTKYR